MLEALLLGHSKKPLLCILLLYSSQEPVSQARLCHLETLAPIRRR